MAARRCSVRRTRTTWRWSSQARSASLQAHDARGAVGVQHVHVEREARLELGGAEQRLHQHGGVDGAGLRLQHDADDVRALVADVAEQRELALLHELGDLLDQAGLGDLVGDLGDDDLVAAVLELLALPLGAQAEAAAAGLVGLGDATRAARPGCRRWGSPGRGGGGGGRGWWPPGCGSVRARRRRVRRRCGAGWRWPCRPRCRWRRWRAGSGRRRGGPPAPAPARRRWRGNRPRRPRCRRAGPAPPPSGGLRCSAWPRRCRRRCCRNCPGPRPAGSGRRSPGRGGPGPRRSRRRRAGGTCPSRRRRCGRTSSAPRPGPA